MKLQMNGEFEKVISGFNPEVQAIARAARALIYEILPQVVEVVWERQKTVGYGTGPKKMSEHFCWIAPYKRHVVLGFYYGAENTVPDTEIFGEVGECRIFVTNGNCFREGKRV